ncbi:MAG: hypothetical protein GTO03_07625, partial [Planctomycetales bacterium]|nr:hypothetical protein [Planctomycetales bacterium]
MFRTQPIDRIGFGEEYFWAVERRLETGGKVERFPFSFSLESLSDNDPDVRARAASNLLDQNGEPEVIVQRMIELMANEQTLYEAILVLRELGLDASPAVPALAKALSHEDEEIRLMAAEALRAIGPQAKGAVPELLKALDDKELIVRMPAVLALGSIGLEAHTAAAKIRSLQKSDDKLLNVCALWALEKIEPDEGRLKTKTMPALINYMRDEDPEVRTAAALAVLQLQPEADVVTDPALRADVFLTLGQIGPAAQGAIASAIEALRD